jgi:hypothetical protein
MVGPSCVGDGTELPGRHEPDVGAEGELRADSSGDPRSQRIVVDAVVNDLKLDGHRRVDTDTYLPEGRLEAGQ